MQCVFLDPPAVLFSSRLIDCISDVGDDTDDEIKNDLNEFIIIPHLWKYATAKSSLDMPYFFNEEKNIGICGDYFNHNNVEAALLSSELLGNKILNI